MRQNYKAPRRNYRIFVTDLGVNKNFLAGHQNTQTIQGETSAIGMHQNEKFCLTKN